MIRRTLVLCLLASISGAVQAAFAAADLSVTNVDTPDPVTVGTNLTYTITVTNAGPSAAPTASLVDMLSAGTTFVSLASPGGWSCTTPAVGLTGTISCSNPSFGVGSAVFTLTVAVFFNISPGSTISNTATVSSATADPNPGNESATATTTIAADTAPIRLSKSSFPFPVVAGQILSYFISATNASGSDLGSATLTDALPAGTTFDSFLGPVPAGWTCITPPMGTNGTVTCSATPFLQGSANFSINVRVSAALPAGTVLTNTAHLIVTDGANVTTRDATTTTGVITPGVIVFGTKTVSGGPHTPGSPLTYTVVLTNNGNSPQGNNPGDEFTDVLPAGLTLVSATATSGTATATVAIRTVTWNGSIPAHGSVTITIQATIDANVAPGTTLSNQGTFAFDTDGSGGNESSGKTDDPAVSGTADPTNITVEQAIGQIPTLDPLGLALLTLLMAGAAVWTMRLRG